MYDRLNRTMLVIAVVVVFTHAPWRRGHWPKARNTDAASAL